MLAHVAHGGVENRSEAVSEGAALVKPEEVSATLAGDVLARLALVGRRRQVHTHGGQGLAGVVAGRHGLVTHAERVLAVSDVLQRDVLEVGAFLGNHHEVVLEHVNARGAVNVALLRSGVHGTLRSADQQVSVGTGAQHLVELAGSLVLRVGERHVGVTVGDVGGLNLFHGLRQRVSGEHLQLDLLLVVVGSLLGLRGVGLLLRRAAVVRRAAGQSEGAHHRERAYGRDHDAKLLLHCFPFLPVVGLLPHAAAMRFMR